MKGIWFTHILSIIQQCRQETRLGVNGIFPNILKTLFLILLCCFSFPWSLENICKSGEADHFPFYCSDSCVKHICSQRSTPRSLHHGLVQVQGSLLFLMGCEESLVCHHTIFALCRWCGSVSQRSWVGEIEYDVWLQHKQQFGYCTKQERLVGGQHFIFSNWTTVQPKASS